MVNFECSCTNTNFYIDDFDSQEPNLKAVVCTSCRKIMYIYKDDEDLREKINEHSSDIDELKEQVGL